MTQSAAFSRYKADVLPPAIVRYLGAQADTGNRELLVDVFATDASVTDEGITHRGRDAIRRWLATAATEFTYTTTLIGQRSDETDRWTVLARIDGNFPGGTANLRFQFAVQADEITELVIAA